VFYLTLPYYTLKHARALAVSKMNGIAKHVLANSAGSLLALSNVAFAL
jgi:hypothetical protein